MSSLRVRILGGGVAGLSSALALYKRAGVRDLRVLEREDQTSFASPAGHGLMLMQNGVRALAALGVSGLLDGCTPITRALFQDGGGAAVRRESLQGVYCVTRTALVRGLRAALPPDAIEFDRRIERVELSEPLRDATKPGAHDRRVRAVRFRSGPALLDDDFDLLVGAEGVRSPLSEALNPGLERPRSRVMEVVTSTELPRLAAQLGSSFVKTSFSDRGLAFGLLAPTPRTVIGFLQFDSERHAPPSAGAGATDFERFLVEVLAGAPEPIPTYLRHANFASAHLWMPVNTDLPRALRCGNAVLVGDAGHPLLPFTSQGASAALEDAVILSDVVASDGSRDGGDLGCLSGFCEDRRRDLVAYVEGGRLILSNFLDSSSGFVAPYVDGAASKLEEHLSLPKGGLRALFRVLDLDGSGRLDETEFRHALDLIELSSSTGEARRLFAEIDADGDGALTLEEFIVAFGSDVGGSELLRRARAELTPRRVQIHTLTGRCRAWFRTMDEDDDRAVDFSEFANGLLFLGIEMTHADCRALFDELDENHDGKIDFDEFSRGARRRLGALDRTNPIDGVAADPFFSDGAVDLAVLKRRAYNYRWAVQPDGVIPLTAADPDFPVAPEIIRAIEEYARAGYLSYGPAEGLPELRSIASERLSARRGISCSFEDVFVTDGAASGMFLVARFALSPGDEAIVFDPVDFLFERSVVAVGGAVKRLPLRSERDDSFDLDELESLVTPRTRLLSICSPHNPVGRVWTKKELEQLATVAVRHDLWILSDEVWSDIVYPPHRHISTASLDAEVRRRTFSVFGFSKSYGLAGLRLGLLISPNDEVHRAIVRISHADDTAYGVSTLSQVAGAAAYRSCDAWLDRFLAHLRSQRDYAVDRLNRIDGVRCRAPEGTFVLFPDVSSIAGDATVLTERLVSRHRIAVVPGSPAFFGPRAQGHLRMSFATSRSILREGLDRLEAGLRDAGGGALQ